MQAAAQLRREPGDLHYPHHVTVFLLEERLRPHLPGMLHVALFHCQIRILQYAGIDLHLHGEELFPRHGLEVGEVEPQAALSHKGAGLPDMAAQNPAQGLVKQVRGRVVSPDGGAPVVVHTCPHPVTCREAPRKDLHLVDHEPPAADHRIDHFGLAAR